MSALKIADPVLAILEQARLDGNKLYLDHLGTFDPKLGRKTLDRKLYADVNKVLEAIGGKWNRGAQAHIFDEAAEPLIETILEARVYSRVKQDLGQFDSPLGVAAAVMMELGIQEGMTALEPQAGVGNLAVAMRGAGAEVMCVEIDEKRAAKLVALDLGSVIVGNFLGMEGLAKVDRIGMNPPFANQVDIDHVLHAFKFLKPGGRLVSVMSRGAMQRVNKKATAFREFVWAHGGRFIELPDGAFSSSGTEVHTCIVVIPD